MCHSVPVSVFAFSTHYDIQSVTGTQWNSQPARCKHTPRTFTFLGENVFNTQSNKNLPIPTPIQIHAWNIAKAAMGQIHHNFISWWPPHMLIIRQPDKMLTDLTNSKGSKEFSATSMEILVSGVDQKCFWTLCLYTVHMGTWIRYEIQQCHFFIPLLTHNSYIGNFHLQVCHINA